MTVFAICLLAAGGWSVEKYTRPAPSGLVQGTVLCERRTRCLADRDEERIDERMPDGRHRVSVAVTAKESLTIVPEWTFELPQIDAARAVVEPVSETEEIGHCPGERSPAVYVEDVETGVSRYVWTELPYAAVRTNAGVIAVRVFGDPKRLAAGERLAWYGDCYEVTKPHAGAAGRDKVRRYAEALPRVRQRLVALLRDSEIVPSPTHPEPAGLDVGRILAELRPDGSFAGIDYVRMTRGQWCADGHFARMAVLAREAARDPGNAPVVDAFRRAMAYWFAVPRWNSNWFWNEIRLPALTAEILLVGGGLLPAETYRRAMRKVRCGRIGMTGQNRMSLANVELMRGLLENDALRVLRARDAIAETIAVTPDEGIRPDFIFQQHGHQPQMSSYGAVFVRQMARTFVLFEGTPLALPDEKREIVRRLVADGYRWIVRNGRIDVASFGRKFGPGCAQGKFRSIASALDALAPAADPIGFRFFDCSCYAVFRRPGWWASVKMQAGDVVGTEWVNEDNPLGGHFADGALWVYADGDEYDDVFPLWRDWRLVPGVTSYAGKEPLRDRIREHYMNRDGFCRQAGTAERPVVRFLNDREGLVVEKSWTFLPDRVLSEGVIRSATNAAYEVVTTVENARAKANAHLVSQTEAETVAVNGGKTFVVKAPPSAVRLRIEDRSGDFSVNKGDLPPTPVAGRVFELTVLHGRCPANVPYRYEVIVKGER